MNIDAMKAASIIEVEKMLLSAMMLKEGAAIPTVEQMLDADDFLRVEHRLIYAAMLRVYDDGAPPDIFLIEEELKKTGDLARVKHSYLFGLIDREFTTARVEAQATAIKEAARLRELKELGERMADEADGGVKSSEEIAAYVEKILYKAPEETVRENSSDVYKQMVNELLNRGKDGAASGLSTGLIGLNGIIGGLRKPDLIILAARPAMGKTALAMNIAAKVAREKKVVFFSLEMSKKQLYQRLLSSYSGVAATRIFREELANWEMEKVFSAAADFKELNLIVYDKGGMTLRELKSRARYEKQKYGLDFIVIDYLQLIQASREYRGNRVQEVSEISRGLKALAKELDVPILALSQLSRGVELRADKRPQLSDLRDSGSIEQDADIVMFLYREEYYNPDDADNEKVAELNVAKHRNGATGTAYLQFEKKYMQFKDLTWRDSQ